MVTIGSRRRWPSVTAGLRPLAARLTSWRSQTRIRGASTWPARRCCRGFSIRTATGNSIGALQAILRKYLAGEPRLLEDTGWLIGFGYDDSQLLEHRHPTRHDLDAVSAEVPILVIHQSGHLGAVNSAGLRAIGIDAATPDPDGGAFRREDDSAEPNGVAEEYAFFRLIFSALAGASDSLKDDMLLAGTRAMAVLAASFRRRRSS